MLTSSQKKKTQSKGTIERIVSRAKTHILRWIVLELVKKTC